ncbi:MAG: hypothetical protein HKN02_06510 [Rhodobacteraceae bacterium]|nr:hypothetical protein [Paracoccaceae bacterium]
MPAVQDEITTVIVNTMFGQIAHLHHRRVLGKDPGTVDAYVHVLKATEHALRVAPGDNEIAKSEVEAAIAIDPEFARAHAVRALTLVNEANNFWVADQDASERLAHEAALAAIATDSRDPDPATDGVGNAGTFERAWLLRRGAGACRTHG